MAGLHRLYAQCCGSCWCHFSGYVRAHACCHRHAVLRHWFIASPQVLPLRSLNRPAVTHPPGWSNTEVTWPSGSPAGIRVSALRCFGWTYLRSLRQLGSVAFSSAAYCTNCLYWGCSYRSPQGCIPIGLHPTTPDHQQAWSGDSTMHSYRFAF